MGDYLLYIMGISIAVNIAFMYLSKKKGIFIDGVNKNHSIHKKDTPRIGGIGIFISSAGMSLVPLGFLFFVSSIPIFLIGMLEDLKSNISPKIRLLFMVFSAVLSIILLDAVVHDIDYIHFPLIVAVIFTLFGVIGVVNALNIIDGLNGLASGVSLLAFLSFGYVFYLYQDNEMMFISLILAAATAGFLLINYPKGFIFLGDSGSYFLGFSLAILSVLMVNRHPEVSAWFPLVLVVYPVWEVLFSIYRRKFLQKKNAMEPDKLHLHCLLCKRVICSNPLTSLCILIFIAIFDITAIYFRENSLILTSLAFTFAIIYTLFYSLTVMFKATHFKRLGNGIYRLIYIYKLFL